MSAGVPTDQIGKEQIIGESPCMVALLRDAKKFAQTDATVLVRGETGTGKELIARYLHYSSTRSGMPFIPLNCGAIPDDLVENELFGHEAGAYTTAKDRYAGLFSQARGGTLFLDEVNALSTKTQVALLRVLEHHEYRPLGSSQNQQSDVRLISASNQCLQELVAKGTFREDLYFRLQILRLELPSLRHRSGDIALLAEHFLYSFSLQYESPAKRLGDCARNYLRTHRWPGNVRELQNTLLRAFLLVDNDVIRAADIKGQNAAATRYSTRSRRSPIPFREAKSKAIEAFERGYLTDLMKEAHGNVSQAARISGKERRALGKLLKKHALNHHLREINHN